MLPLPPVAPRQRVVIVGSSVGYFMRPRRTLLDERTYAEHLETGLRARGIEAWVTNSSRWTMLVDESIKRIEDLVYQHAPDVVIANFGLLECEPVTIPMSLLRWLYTTRPSSSWPARALRRGLAPPLTRLYTGGSPRVLRVFPLPSRRSATRFERELETFVHLVAAERGVPVLLLGVTPPGARLEHVLPGTTERAARYTEIVRAVAERSPRARFVDVANLVREQLEEFVPDGIHFSPAGHRRLGEALVEEVIALGAAGV